MRHRSSLVPLALAYAALIVYASLYPFSGWRWPPGAGLAELLWLPWPRWRIAFDLQSNLIGYLPLGGLAYGALVRSGVGRGAALAGSLLAPAALSYGLEVLQQLLPQRHPSRIDWALNAAGAALGALLGALLHRLGAVEAWQRLRERWFERRSAAGLALLMLWPLGLLFPAPVPLGLGQVGERLREALHALLDDIDWAAPLAQALAAPWTADAPLGPAAEAATVIAGLLAPCLVAFALTRPGWRRLPLVAGALGLAVGTLTLATALNFGPEHAWAWRTATSLPAMLAGCAIAVALAGVGPRLAAALGLIALTALVVLVAQAPEDPFFALSLRSWEQGRFIRFHGLAQWIGWLWPYASIAWLLWRLGRREAG